MNLPEQTRVYQNHHMDGTRWKWFEPRPDDIVIATSYKAGTTWTQAIVAHLLFRGDEMPDSVPALSPWLDMRTVPLEVILNGLEAQQHRRFIKTHLPLDGMRYEPQMKYLYVARDTRDVFMSLWNHYTRHTPDLFLQLNGIPGRVGDEFPQPPEDIHEFWKSWITRGGFDWESDGWPYWSHLSHVQSWWNHRELPNLLMVHFNDLLSDCGGEVQRIADFLEIEIPEGELPAIVEAVSFAEMKKQGERYAPNGGEHWEGGAETFLHKGTNGRWREVLSDEEVALYDAACEKVLAPECRRWLEGGRHA